MSAELTTYLAKGIGLVAIILLAILVDHITKRFLLSWVSRIVSKTKSSWDDALLRYKLFNQLAHLSPAIVLYLLLPVVLNAESIIVTYLQNGLIIYMIILAILAFDALLSVSHDIYNTFPISRNVPIKSFIQVAKSKTSWNGHINFFTHLIV